MLFPELIEVLDPQPHGAALNMAIDEVLLRESAAPLLRAYRWARPAVSFGYFGRHAEVVAAWPEHDLVRRWTGGGIVPHGEDVTYTIVVPRGASPFFEMSPPDFYCAIHQCIARLLGAEATLAPTAAQKVSDACFENAAQHDVLGSGRKLAGAAQRRTRFGLLHQGSIQLSENAGTIRAGLGAAVSARVIPREISCREVAAAEQLAATKYASDTWTRRL